ncbi:hypothetical protein [Lysinibacillus contaminans]|nr:hypothetical protein [Lysinibacillus contaminans]
MKKYWEIGLSAFLTIGLLTACNKEEVKLNQQTEVPRSADRLEVFA